MIRPSQILIDAFLERLAADYARHFDHGPAGHLEALRRVAWMVLPRIARTDALYHDLEHTLQVTLVGQAMLRGRMVRNGDVRSLDYVHFVASLLSFAVGFLRGECPGDTATQVVVDGDGTLADPPRGATNGWLWPYYTDRSIRFVRHYFAEDAVLDVEELAQNIEYARFPPEAGSNTETASYPGLLRAAHLIGAVADPGFMLKLKPLFLELREAGLVERLAFRSVAEFRNDYPAFFWRVLAPFIRDGIRLLEYTDDGRMWLAQMHAHVLAEEHRGGH